MTLTKTDLAEIKNLLDDQRSLIMLDVKVSLLPIQEDLTHVKERLDQLFKTESEDVGAAYREIESLKRLVTKLDKRIAALERR